MSVRGPNNFGRAVKTDPTLLRYASAITEQKKCWELLAEKFDRFQTLRNNTQQHPTTCNSVCKRRHSCNIQQCWELLVNNVASICTQPNMTPRLSGYISKFGLDFFVLKSQWSREKFAPLSLKSRNHVRILIYRAWAILSAKAPCKRTQHCWPTTPSTVGCYMLRPFAHPVVCCWMLLRVVA